MRVALHAGQLLQTIPGGIGRYVESLLRHMPEVGVEPVAFAAGGAPPEISAEWIDLGAPRGGARYALWHRFRRPHLDLDADVVHAPSLAIPPPSEQPLVVTVHDVAFLRFPDTFTRRGRRFHERGLELARRDAQQIVVASEFSRRELVDEGFDPEAVVVIPHGSDVLTPLSSEEVDWQLARASVSGRFVLTVGTVEPRKNVAALVEAMTIVREAAPDVTLVVVGPAGWGEVPDLTGEGVRWLGRVDERRLEALYRRATLCCQLSLYEGFGLPALEAMTRDCPVVVSGGGALEEVVGAAGAVVDAASVDAVAAAVGSLIEDEERRREMASRGRERAAQFGWARSVAEHARVYARLIE